MGKSGASAREVSPMHSHDDYYREKSAICEKNGAIPAELYEAYDVKKGLRDRNGKGVVTGITRVSKLNGYDVIDGKRVPIEGRLAYRGYDIHDLVYNHVCDGLRVEEAGYLLLFGELPNKKQLGEFRGIIADNMHLSNSFLNNVIFRENCSDIMNTMARGILELENYDKDIDNVSVEHILKQCMRIIGVAPLLAVYGYHAHNHYDRNKSLIIHRADKSLGLAENFLHILRADGKFTALEANALDAALTVHMEHGGGNNSAFTIRVVTSSGSDTYSVMAAAILSLKGPKHGGANIKVVKMIDDLKHHVHNYEDEDAIREYLKGILRKENFDKQGLIYGMGHAVYSVSDPRATILKDFVTKLAKEKNRTKELRLYERVDRIGRELLEDKKGAGFKPCINVDFYSGFLYRMLHIPEELFTPLFAVARTIGWSAHRIEEIVSSGKIIRPAYVSIAEDREYIPLDERD